MMKSQLNDYFTFSKGQQRGIMLLLTLIVLVSIIYFLLPSIVQSKTTPSNDTLTALMSSIEMDTAYESNTHYAKKESYKPSILTPFLFDPNTLDEAGFKRLGLRDKLVSTLLNYRNKGGRFYNNESLKRIYGLHDEEYKQLEPFIRIEGASANGFGKKPAEIISVELNSADTTQLIRLRGIGSKLSLNIIRRREQLGGFASIEQIKEVYGISDETFALIKSSLHINKALIKTLNLNAATLYELNAHPYLRGEIARALVDYRKAHNYNIEDLNQIKEIPLINEEIFRKIVNYLRI